MVALGEPGVPVICWALAKGAAASTAATSIPHRRTCLFGFMGCLVLSAWLVSFGGGSWGAFASEDVYFVREGSLSTERVTCTLSAAITHRKPVWDEPVSGGVPRRALGR